MTWTYSNDPANSERDRVRLWVGDTDSNDPQITDEEIAFFLSDAGSPVAAALMAAQMLAAKYARAVDKSVGDLRLSYSQRAKAYQALVSDLRFRVATRTAPPFAGGISKTQKEATVSDTDRVPPAFTRDQFDYP